jgi:lipid A 4'-phosphatase
MIGGGFQPDSEALPVPATASWTGDRWPLVGPALALLGFSLLLSLTRLDVLCSQPFYDPVSNDWPALHEQPWNSIYLWGVYPPVAIAVVAIGMLIWPRRWGRVFAVVRQRLSVLGDPAAHSESPSSLRVASNDRGWTRRAAIVLLATLLVGPVLTVNWGLKTYWGRPRPKQVVEFGGDRAFVPLGLPGPTTLTNSSFPSGHAAIAFYMLAPMFVVRRRDRGAAWGWMVIGLAAGGIMSWTRLISGGHFVSDLIWAAASVYFPGEILARVLLDRRTRSPAAVQPRSGGTDLTLAPTDPPLCNTVGTGPGGPEVSRAA